MGKDLKGRQLGQYLSQRKDGRYQARFTDRFGKRQEKKSKSLKEVKEWLKEEKAKDDLGLNKKDVNDTLDIWYQKWKRNAFVDLAFGTKKNYLWAYEQCIYPEFGNKKIAEINEFEIQTFFQNLKYKYEDGSIQSVKNVFSQIMQCCKDAKCISYNPVKEVKPKKRRKDEDEIDSKALNITEQRILFDFLKGHFYYNLFVFYLTTGLRYGEATALTLNDIDLNKKVVHITKALKYEKNNGKHEFYIGKTKTKSSVRKVPLNDIACETIKRQVKLKQIIANSKYAVPTSSEFKNLLFVTHHNTPILNSTLNYLLSSVRTQINYQLEDDQQMITLSVHRLRHTFATRCYENGIPLKVISKYLGHSSVAVTEKIYVHLLKEHLELQSEKLNSAYNMQDIGADKDKILLIS